MDTASLRPLITRYGARRVIARVTLLSVLFSLVITSAILYLTGARQFHEFSLGLFIATIVPILVGPTLTYAFFRLLEQLNRAETQQARSVEELEQALAAITVLPGLLPICSSCKKIRDDQGYWAQIEEYLHAHADVEFTHSFCPDCADSLFREMAKKPS